MTLDDGLGRGVRVIEFRTGSGFCFDVLVDRCFDIGRCEIGGRPLNWQANPGIVAPWFYENDELGLVPRLGRRDGRDLRPRSHPAGPAKTTPRTTTRPHIFKTVHYGLHGRAGGLPARLVGYGERWEGDECVLWAEGEVLQSAIFGEHLLLRRRIEARRRRVALHDPRRGRERRPQPRLSHMLLYHCNAGFPVVDDGSRLLVPSLQDDDRLRRHARADGQLPDPQRAHQGLQREVLRARARGRGATARCRSPSSTRTRAGRLPGLPNRPAAAPHGLADDGRGHLRHGHGAQHEPRRRPLGCQGARRAACTWSRARARPYDLEIGALDGVAAIDAFERRVLAIDVGRP